MRYWLVGGVILGLSATAQAQTISTVPGFRTLEPRSLTIDAESRQGLALGGSGLETPTMRRAKLREALALRDDADRLLGADGGTLTPEHAAYIRAASRRILSPSNALPIRKPAVLREATARPQ